MSKIHSSKIHHSYEASIGYGASTLMLVKEIRRQIQHIKNHKKADLITLGTLHALRMLCEGDAQHYSLYTTEINEWQEVFMNWFERIKKQIPAEVISEFKQNLEEDFEIILNCSQDEPEWMWRKDAEERQICVQVKNDETLRQYTEAVATIVDSPTPLHQYLENCLGDLLTPKNEPQNYTQKQNSC